MGRVPRTIASLAVALATVAALTLAADAQVVRGTVQDPAANPVPGVVVTLLDTAGTLVVRTMSATDGAFSLRAPVAGRYRLRTLRIGFQPVTSGVFALAVGESRDERITFDGAPVTIEPVVVVGASICGRRSGSDPRAVFAAWDQAMTAVSAASVTSSAGAIFATTMDVERILDPAGRRIRSQMARVSTDLVTHPWRSLPLGALRAYGYSQVDQQGFTIYHAPGLDVLASGGFVEDHCLRLVSARDTSEVGIAFEPNPSRRREAEIRGTAWMHRASAQLRRIEFTYVNVPDAPADVGDRAGGTMSFDRLADGSVVISQWEIRMPQFERPAPRSPDVRVAEIVGVGGLLITAVRGGDTLYRRPTIDVRGVVLDSVSGRVIAEARVELAGTAVRTTSGSDGGFTLADVLPGEYEIAVRTPSLDSLRAVSQTELLVTEGMAPLTLRVPRATELAIALCGRALTGSAGRGRGAVVGLVVDGSGAPLAAGTAVTAEWTETTLAGGAGGIRNTRRGLQTRSDVNGSFRLCGVPRETALRVAAMPDSGRAIPLTIRLEPNQLFAAANLTVDRTRSAVAAFVGVVEEDSTQRPLANVEVVLPDLDLTTRTDSAGRFRIGEIPAGTHRVVARRLGFGVLETELTFAPHEELDRRIVLSDIAQLSQVNIVATPLDYALLEFEENRRVGLGRFMTREQLARFDALPLPTALSQFSALEMESMRGGSRVPTARRVRVSLGQLISGQCLPPLYSDPLGGVPCNCYARVYVDGVLRNPQSPTPPYDVNELMTEGVEAIEWYPSPAGLPGRYLDLNAACGVLVIHTRRDPPETPAAARRRARADSLAADSTARRPPP